MKKYRSNKGLKKLDEIKVAIRSGTAALKPKEDQ